MPHAQKITFFTIGVFFLSHLFLISFAPQVGAVFSGLKLADFEVGDPAPRDLYVEKDITYIDEEATALKKEATEELVSPVFAINNEITNRSISRFSNFSNVLTEARTKIGRAHV